jgi:hypothetical protein
MSKMLKTLFWILVAMGALFLWDTWEAEAQTYPNVNYAAYIYSSGSWAAAPSTTSSGAWAGYTLPGVNLYCYNTSTQKWVPADSNCFGGGGGGGDTITSPNSTLTVGGSASATTLDINLGKSNSWTVAQTFGGSTNTFNNATASTENDVIIEAGTSGNLANAALEFASLSTSEWKLKLDTSNAWHLTDTVNSLDHIEAFQAGQTIINSGGTASVAINNSSSSGTGGFIVYEGGTNNTVQALNVSSSGNATVGSASGSGNLVLGNHLNQAATADYAGSCTMTTTTCTVSFQHSWTSTPACVATVQGATPLYAAVSVSSNVATVTASGTNTSTWNVVCPGNPN